MTVMQTTTAKDLALLSNGSYSTGKGQAQNDYIWDRILMPSAPSSQGLSFFRTPRSGAYGTTAGDQKTEIETSMEDTGKLPAGQNFLCNAIAIHLITTNAFQADGVYVAHTDQILQAWKIYMQHTNFTFKFTNVEYSWRTPGLTFLPAVWENGFSAAGATGQQIVRNGDFQHLSWINMPTRVPITEQVNFTLTAFTTSGSNTSATTSILPLVENAMEFLSNSNQGEVSPTTAVQCEIQASIRGLLTRAI